LIEKYYPRLTLDFQTNKKIAAEVAIIPSKRLRNKIAGFTTHLMKRISKGPVRGISFKLQEEERERKDNYVPDRSALALDTIEVDSTTMVLSILVFCELWANNIQALLKSIGFDSIENISVQDAVAAAPQTFKGRRERGDKPPRRERKE